MINSKRTIEEFLSQKIIAVVGVSRNKDKFGNAIYRDMKTRGYKVFAVNPNADMVEGDRCYAGLGALPEKPDGVILVLPPRQTLQVIEEIANIGIRYVWLQQGADSPEAERRCRELDLKFVSGECIFMFAEPMQSFHKFHRFFNRLFGKMPK